MGVECVTDTAVHFVTVGEHEYREILNGNKTHLVVHAAREIKAGDCVRIRGPLEPCKPIASTLLRVTYAGGIEEMFRAIGSCVMPIAVLSVQLCE